MSKFLANLALVVVSLARSFCGMTLGSLVAETAYTLAYGNEGDAEFSTIVFKSLVGVFLFLGMPLMYYVLKTAELALHSQPSKLMEYGVTLALLTLAIGVLAGRSFDYEWVIFFSTTAIAWLVYSEAIAWLWAVPSRVKAALAAAGLAVGSAILIPRALFLLDIKPDWARHAAAAAILLVFLASAVAAALALDRRKRRLSF